MIKKIIMNNKRVFLALMAALTIIIISGCATTGAAFTPIHTTGDHAVVYIYRPSKFVGSAGYWTLTINEQPIVDLRNGGYYPYIVGNNKETSFALVDMSSGELMSNPVLIGIAAGPLGVAIGYATEAIINSMDIDKELSMGTYKLEAGKSHYFRYEITGMTKSAIIPVSAEIGEREIKNCRLLEPTIYN